MHVHIHLGRAKAKDAFPTKFNFKGKTYISTGNTKRDSAGNMACQYEERDDLGIRTGRTVWLNETGQMLNDKSAKDSTEPEKLKEWRSRTKPGTIMKPSEFEHIKRSAAASGAKDPEAVAGAAYWGAAEHKFKERRKGGKDDTEAKTRDSEENDAYIKGYRDAMAGKEPDREFHPGGEKRPAVALQYAEGHKRGIDDRKKHRGRK